MPQTTARTTRPDLIGKTVVDITDPYSHGNGLVPPRATLYEIVVMEPDYEGVRVLGDLQWRRVWLKPIVQPLLLDFDKLEPGDRLDVYLPGASAVLGTPDFVHFQGRERKKWDREHRSGL